MTCELPLSPGTTMLSRDAAWASATADAKATPIGSPQWRCARGSAAGTESKVSHIDPQSRQSESY